MDNKKERKGRMGRDRRKWIASGIGCHVKLKVGLHNQEQYGFPSDREIFIN
jgi:hypothetical protein